MNALKPIFAFVALSALFAAEGIAATAQPLLILKLDVPAWIAKDSTLHGNVSLETIPGLSHVRCEYTVDGKAESVDCKPGESAKLFSFSIPPLKVAASNSLALAIRAQSADGGVAYESKPHIIALADVSELDITGAAAEVLKYPLQRLGLNAEFIPCCNITGGTTRIERIPINPEPNVDGLPKRLVSSFVRATPCPLSKASAGLALDLLVDTSLSPKPVMANVKAYRWHESSWKPVLNTKLDETRAAISFHVPDGGTFVLGEEAAAR
jgi:hypothetical protein